MWQVAHAWQRQLEKALSPLRLTHLQFVLLAATSWLTEHEGAPSQTRLAEFTSFDPMMTSKVLRLLESRGLLGRTADPERPRVKRVSLTDQGRESLERAFPVWREVNKSYFGRLRTRRSEFAASLDVLIRGK